MGQDGKLNLSGHFQFVVDGHQLAAKLFTGLAQHQVGADAGLNDSEKGRVPRVL
jgi:hypothetical protein